MKKLLLLGAIALSFGISFISCSNPIENKRLEELSEKTQKYSCSNVDDCLAKYEFEGARYYYSKLDGYLEREALEKIIRAEVSFFFNNNEKLKAKQTAEEAALIFIYNEMYVNDLNKQMDQLILDNDWSTIFEYLELIKPLADNKSSVRCGDEYYKGYNLNTGAAYNANRYYTPAANCFNDKLETILLKMDFGGIDKSIIKKFINFSMPQVVSLTPHVPNKCELEESFKESATKNYL